MDKKLNNFLRTACSVFFLLVFVSAGAQQPATITIRGVVLDSKTQEPITGATVSLRDKSIGTATDENGKFSLHIKQPFPVTLVVHFLGYSPQRINMNANEALTILLSEEASKLDEVVVIGYGTQEKKDLTSSISLVKAGEIADVPKVSLNEQLQGQAAGVQVSSNTGIPGEGIFFRIRGTTSINAGNDPLFIVDGVFINNESLQSLTTQGQNTNPLADISSSDIESIEILKDASATAIYGARAANGVVIITTKRGKYNSRPTISLNTSAGWSWSPDLWNLVTGPEHATIINEAWVNDGKSFETRPFRPASEGGRGLPEEQKTYDRLNDVFRTGFLQSTDISVTGGTENTRYYIGGDYTKQEATMKPVYFERLSGKVNLDQKISKKISVSTSNTIATTYRKQARIGDGPQGGMLQAALHTPTYLPKFLDDGSYAKWAGFDNLDVLIKYTDMNSRSNRYIGNLRVNVQLLPNLDFSSSWGLDYNDYHEFEYWNSLTLLGAPSTDGAPGGTGNEIDTKNNIWVNEQTIQYTKVFGEKHNLSALIGNTIQKNTRSVVSVSGSGFPNDDFKLIASASSTSGTAYNSANGLASFFGRINYDYAKKYFLSLSLRRDGSSKFSSGNKWGTFPSVGLGWQLKEEQFLKGAHWIQSLKLRASYGVVGNQNGIGDFASRGLWSGGRNYLELPGIGPDQLANDNLKWETTKQTDVGFNLNAFNGRISVDFDYYYKYTTDLLLQFPLPVKTGYSSIYRNDGEISNQGFELTVNTLNISTNDFTWSSAINLARNKNKIEKLAVPINQYNRDWVRMEEGHPLYSFWLYKQLYVDPETGDAVFEGQKEDGSVPTEARQILGDTWPDLFGGIRNDLKFKNFDLSVLFNFSYGNDVFNLNRYFLESGGTRDDRRALHAHQLERWQKPGDITEVPRVTTTGNNYRLEQNSRFLEDGSFLRLSLLTFGYTIPKSISERISASSIRFYFTGSNLWLWKKYTDPDPEINVAGDNQNVQGLDLGTPPQPRTVQFGVNLTF